MEVLMNFIYIILLFFVTLFLCELFAILLKITGLDMEKARFQVISIITHTGFTTRESELISQHPIRRKMISYLMLLSYVSQATFFTLLFSAIKENDLLYLLLLVGSIFLLLLIILKTSNIILKFEPILTKFISKKWMKTLSSKSLENILYINDEYEVIELIVNTSNPLCNIYLRDLTIDYIKILLIDKGHEIIPTPNGSDFIEQGDRIVVYGKCGSLNKLSN